MNFSLNELKKKKMKNGLFMKNSEKERKISPKTTGSSFRLSERFVH
jgi:hypothetical protein